MQRDVIVAGAGIVGLATAAELTRRGDRVTVLEKESTIAAHQTGRNSGVIHSGLYYSPGSLKARLGTAGARSMRDFAAEHGVPVDICGKLVVATREDQRPALMKLHERGRANGVPVRLIGQAEAAEFEPYVRCVAALRVESTGIVDYRAVCDVLVAAEGMNFCLSEAKLGLLPGTISPYVVRAMGEQMSRRYFVTAERFSATQAAAMGFVHEVCAADALDAKVDELVATLVGNGPMALRACKTLVQDMAGQPITPELRSDTARRIADIRASDEGKEGVQSFLQKRAPSWLS